MKNINVSSKKKKSGGKDIQNLLETFSKTILRK